ncbi:MAG: pseudouridine synthase [Oxalobacteraceae bacterium]|nr:pseudouridine synthase [Oxalobacteraceae bacterium]
MAKLSLDRILQSQGFGTRKWCRQLIEAGEVQIGGDIVRDPRAAFDTDDLQFGLFDEIWSYHQHLYIALNKPGNIECSRKPSHHPGVMSLLPEQFGWRDVQAIGRLDHDTTGLLLLTDDGAFNHAMSSPRRHISKTYLATTAEPVTAALIDRLLGGVKLHDEPAPLAATMCRQVAEFQLEIILEQGKYHQVKRMLAAADHHCSALERIAIGELTLSSLQLALGDWCLLNDAQRGLLR